MRYKAIYQFSYKHQWFEPGEEVKDIPISEIRNLVSQGIVQDLEPPVSESIGESWKGGDDT